MKKLLLFVLIGIFAGCSLVSCVDKQSESNTEPAKATTTETTASTTAVPTETTTSAGTQTTEEEIISIAEATSGAIVDDTTATGGQTESVAEETYETLPDMFEYLMEFPSGKGYFYGKADIRKSTNLAKEEIGVHFRIVGFDHDYRGMVGSYYYVQIIGTYGEDKFADQLTTFTKVEIDPIDRNQIYKMHWRGHLDDHLYGRPPLQIGEDYFRYITWDDHEDGIFTMGLVMDIEEVDGKQYLYGYGIDMSIWECAEKITDEEENQIYKVGQHDKVIAYLNSIGKELPTFDYRCELFEWMDEVGIYTKK